MGSSGKVSRLISSLKNKQGCRQGYYRKFVHLHFFNINLCIIKFEVGEVNMHDKSLLSILTCNSQYLEKENWMRLLLKLSKKTIFQVTWRPLSFATGLVGF